MTSGHSPFFFIEPANVNGDLITLVGSDAHHLAVVRRASVGERVVVSDGEGQIFEGRLRNIERARVLVEISNRSGVAKPAPALTVFQGLAKGGKVDFVIQKLVELGTDEVVVFFAGRSVPRWDSDRAAKARERWISIGREAAKQSRRAWLPRVGGPIALNEVVPLLKEFPAAYVAYELAGVRLKESLPAAAPERLALVIGPEGGLSEDEVAVLAQGGRPVSLGPRILRTETAGIVAATVVASQFGLIG